MVIMDWIFKNPIQIYKIELNCRSRPPFDPNIWISSKSKLKYFDPVLNPDSFLNS